MAVGEQSYTEHGPDRASSPSQGPFYVDNECLLCLLNLPSRRCQWTRSCAAAAWSRWRLSISSLASLQPGGTRRNNGENNVSDRRPDFGCSMLNACKSFCRNLARVPRRTQLKWLRCGRRQQLKAIGNEIHPTFIKPPYTVRGLNRLF